MKQLIELKNRQIDIKKELRESSKAEKLYQIYF